MSASHDINGTQVRSKVGMGEGFKSLRLEVAHTMHFLHRFLRDPGTVGAIAPSSPVLAKAMIRDLFFQPGDSVLELGPGTGAFTKEIQQILPTSKAYVGIECDPKFVQLLEKKFPALDFVTGRAENANNICESKGSLSIKAILSGLPFANQHDLLQSEIISNLERLMFPGTIFRTFQYVHSYSLPNAIEFRRRMSHSFGNHQERQVVFRNLPPAFVLTWQR